MYFEDSFTKGITVRISEALALLLCCMLILVIDLHCACGSSAPNFTLTDIDGNSITLTDYLGKPVLLDFFATWCQPCMKDIPILKTIKDQFLTDLAIISISVDPTTDTIAKLQSFRNSYNVTWTVVRDTKNIYDAYNVTAIPTIYIIDKDSNVRYSHLGTTNASVLADQVSPLILEYPSLTIPIVLGLAIVTAITTKKCRHVTRKASGCQARPGRSAR
jgi:peroxiredoxin